MKGGWIAIVIAAGCGTSSPSSCPPKPFQGQPIVVGSAGALEIALPGSLAFSISSDGNSLYEEQPTDSSAVPIAVFAASSTTGWDQPALRPDGAELFARETMSGTIWSSTLSSGSWTAPAQVNGPWFTYSLASTPAAIGSNGDLRMMIWDDTYLQEYTRTSGTWTSTGPSLSPTDLTGQPAMLASPQLTADGLSLVFLSNPGGPDLTVWHTRRPNVAAAFPLPATAILGPAPMIYSPHLTVDCADLYLVENNHLVRYGH
jgi:hypothetical protein